MIEIMRQLIIAMTALLSLLQPEPKLGAVEESEIQTIQTSQDSHFKLNKKYQSVSPKKLESGGTIQYQEIPYSGPEGKGYEVIMQKVEAGKVYRKVKNYGPEKYRDKEWYLKGTYTDPSFYSASTTP